MIKLPESVLRRSDFKGSCQCLGILAMAGVTGSLAFFLWRSGHEVMALLALLCHGNICSSFGSGIHELGHGTVFKTRWLNKIFLKVFSILHWTDGSKIWDRHKGHHTHTLLDEDPERDGNCRPTWFGTWLWASTFHLPRFVGALLFCPGWILVPQMALAVTFYVMGAWELIWIVNLAPFTCAMVATFCQINQHVGMAINSARPEYEARSVKLPWIISVVNWRMEHHLEHHLMPAVPCYHLSKVRAYVELPAPLTLVEACREMRRHKRQGECGFGQTPLDRIRAGDSLRSLLDLPR